MDDYAADCNFIGPPVGWFGRQCDILFHASLMNRFVSQTTYAEGLVHITGIGQRFEMPVRKGR